MRGILAVWACFLVACDDDASAPTDAGEEAEVGADSADSTDLAFPARPCDDNTGCSGGEICRAGLCREACDSDDPCRGDLAVCDLELSYCVECASAEDCAQDEACVDAECVFFCGSDEACEVQNRCDEATGECVPYECEGDAECLGGYECNDFQCIPIDEIVCEAGDLACDGNTLVVCSPDGTSQDRLDCGERLCVSGEDAARCANVLCEPNEVGCIDDSAAFVCDGTGTVQSVLSCGDGRVCDQGACRDQVCEPDTARCDGNVVVTCDERGLSSETLPCADDEACLASAFGCSCLDGACEERVCTPNASRCVGESRQICAADGLSYQPPVPCGEATTCVAGACLSRVCVPASRECIGDVLVTCNAEGTARTEDDCTEDDGVCAGEGAGARCTPRVCEPDAVACNATRSGVVACDARGGSESTTLCVDGAYCEGGACLPEVCEPSGPDTCVAGEVQRCDALGSGYVLVEDCEDETQSCMGGTCVDLACEPSAIRCSGELLLECDAEGLEELSTDCADDGAFCDEESLACEPRVCEPGSPALCSESGDVVRCDSRGSGFETVEECRGAGCLDAACSIPEGCVARTRDGRAYWFCSLPRTWEDALDFCEAESMTLVALNSTAEDDWVAETGAELITERADFGSTVAWIGLNRVGGTLRWTSGDSVAYTDIADSDDGPDAAFRTLLACGPEASDCEAGRWYDSPRSSPVFSFICEDQECDGPCPSVGCADGSVEGGVELWNRADIVLCASSTGGKVSLVEAAALCGGGWDVCTPAELVARNDDCTNAIGSFWARLDHPDCCADHRNDDFSCDNDGARNNCSGVGGGSPWSMQGCGWDSYGVHGTLCCR